MFEKLASYSPEISEGIYGARDYILHRGRHQLLSANWKSAEAGEIVYAAGTLDLHIRNSYHNAFHPSKRESRKQTMYTHLRMEDSMSRLRNLAGLNFAFEITKGFRCLVTSTSNGNVLQKAGDFLGDREIRIRREHARDLY